MQCVVYAVLLQCCFVASASLLSTNHSLRMYWCVTKVVYASCEVCCLCCSSIECKQHISFNTSIFNTAHLHPICWLVIIKHAVRNLVALTNQCKFRRHLLLISNQ